MRRNKIKLLLVDDHPIVREGIRSRLAMLDYLEIVGEASGGKEAVSKARALSPDIVLMDISLPGISGVAATKLLRKAAPRARVLVLTAYNKREYVTEVMRAGARGYLLKDGSPDDLIRAIEAVNDGKTYFSSAVFQAVARDDAGTASERGKPAALSANELRVLALIAEGATSKDVARQMGVGLRTVETYRERMMRKLDIHSVAGLTKFALSAGIIRLE